MHMDGNEISSAQYVAHCQVCQSTRPLTREQIMTGKNPICEHCGQAMVVYLQGGPRAAPKKKTA